MSACSIDSSDAKAPRSMTPARIDRIAPNGKTIPVIVIDGEGWLSQASLATLFAKTKANMSLHLTDICRRAGNIPLSREVRVQKMEGRRHIVRAVIHYSLEACLMIALRGQHWDEHNWLMHVASEVTPHEREYRIVPVKERDFQELIQTVLRGIVTVESQYRVGDYSIDFYLPECALAIEFDESHHAKPRHNAADREREKAIRRALPEVQFIRIFEGQELRKLNDILRAVMKSRDPTVPSHRAKGRPRLSDRAEGRIGKASQVKRRRG